MLHKQLAGLICSALLLLPIGFNGKDALLPSPTPKVTAAALWEETGLSFNPETAIEPEDRFFYEEEVVFQQEEIGLWSYRSPELAVFIRRHKTTVLSENGRPYPQVSLYAHIYMRQFNSYHSGFATEAKDGISLAPAWQIARKNKAVLAITGDNITQQDKERKGVILRQGRVYLDGKAASFCALKDDLTMEIFTGGERNAEELLEEGIRETVSFGPWLVRDGKGNNQVQLSPVNRVNPRVGLGMIAPGHFLAIVCDGRQSNYSYGLTLEQFRDLFLEAGCVQAYNMDGGCSTGMLFMGEHLNRHDGSAGSADYQRRWPDALLWGYSSLVPGVEDPLLHNGNQER